MPRITAADALTQGLIAHGIDTVFGLPGAQIYGLFDAFYRAQPQLRVIGARHEQTTGYMAFGYARSTGRPSCCAVVPGPGLLNASAALLTAFGANEQVLCITGQAPTDFLDRGKGALHEMPDQLGTARGFVRWAERIAHAGEASATIARAIYHMRHGRPGPALLEMPWDVFTQETEAKLTPPLKGGLSYPAIDTDKMAEAAKILKAAHSPMIFVGSGAFHAAESVLELAELLDAPVVAFRSGRGIVSNAHELGLTIAEAYKLWPQTDAALIIGSRAEVARWRWPARADLGAVPIKTIRIDIDPMEFIREKPDVAILGDSAEGAAALLKALLKGGGPSKGGAAEDKREAIRDARIVTEREIAEVQPQISYLRALRDVLPDDAIVTDELSQVGFASWYGFPIYEPRTFISSGYQGTLGSGFPTALGVKAAHPDKVVVAITGDGGFMFAAQELATAVQYELGVITLVFNNNAYGNVRRDQEQGFGGRIIGADLVNPDFVRFAESFGAGAVRVETPDDFRVALKRAMKDGGPWLIEISVPTGSETSPWAFIAPRA